MGKGFFLTPEEYSALIKINKTNKDVLFPVYNGDDLNNSVDLTKERYIINFFEWDLSKCENYTECFNIVKTKVLPERLKQNDKGAIEKWWQYLRPRTELYSKIKPLNKCIGIALTSKTLAFRFIPTDVVYTHAVGLFTKDDASFFCILQSVLHSVWAWKFGSTMKSDLRYTSSDIFETFPFPKIIDPTIEINLESVGQTYHSFRQELMINIQLGLTKVYNLFNVVSINTPEDYNINAINQGKKTIERLYGKEAVHLWEHLQKTNGTYSFKDALSGILKLRHLHVEMDKAVLEAYGWSDMIHDNYTRIKSALGEESGKLHDFYEVDYLPENDRVRYTIHPAARKEILKRLLELNHKIHEEEVKAGLWDKKPAKEYKQKKKKTDQVKEEEKGYGGLFD